MPMDDMECIFCIGDGIEIMAEQYKGQNGTLFLEETRKSNHLGHTFQWRHTCEFFELRFQSKSDHSYKISISISCYPVTSCLVTSNASAKKIKVGKVWVISGPLAASKGEVSHRQAYILLMWQGWGLLGFISEHWEGTELKESSTALNHIQQCSGRFQICTSYCTWWSCEDVSGPICISPITSDRENIQQTYPVQWSSSTDCESCTKIRYY